MVVLLMGKEKETADSDEMTSLKVKKSVARLVGKVATHRGLSMADLFEQEDVRAFFAHLLLAESFGPRQLATLTAEEIEAWAARPTWSPSTQNSYLGTVQSALKWAGCSLPIRRPAKESRGADTCLTDEQFAKVLKELRRGNYGADIPELLEALRECGARPQELATLQVEAVDWSNGCTRKREHKTRRHTGTDRVIYFNSAALAILQRQREKHGTGILFRTRSGNPYRPQVIVRRLGEVSDRLGFRVIAYGLGRHSFATRALEVGVPDVLVASLLGHRGTAMLHAHYSHVGEAARALRDAAERVVQTKSA